MPHKASDPGARNAGAGRDWLNATSRPVISPMDLRAQRLVRVHHLHPALAPIVAALVWQERGR